jgi:Zn-dependent protease with chaperone function
LIQARFYDGRTSGARPASLLLTGSGGAARLIVRVGETESSVALSALTIGERVGETNRLLELPDGGSLEVLNNGAFDAALEAAGLSTAEAPIRRLESRWRYALLAVMATVLATVGFVRFGAPALAARAVQFIPPSVDSAIAMDTLKVLDRSSFGPSQLPAPRQAELRRIFAQVTAGASPDSAHFRLEFRGGGSIGANAFALPSGIVVLTDELEQAAETDDELRGVFAHEVGHLVNRHAMRMLVQGSAAALLIVGVFGDVSGVSSVATAAPGMLLNAAYSRDFEREADAFAFHWMRDHGVEPRHLADLLQRLAKREGGAPEGGFLATHPGLEERVRAASGAG